MPRKARRVAQSGIYHVMMRGINHQQIFEEDEDYRVFLRILRKCKNISGFKILAYCLMGNHIHLLIKEDEEKLELIFKRIGVRFVKWYNQKYQRCGHLFQDRFKSEVVDDERYLITVAGYIHQNPVKSGLVKEVRDYQWSSWPEYEGQSGHPVICDIYSVLKRLNAENVYEWVTMPVNEDFILDVDSKTNSVITDDELKSYIVEMTGLLTSQDISTLPKPERNRILKDLCNYGASVRQIARVTGVAYGVVYRINAKR
jgi:REP element-mobilizing transposase RayT